MKKLIWIVVLSGLLALLMALSITSTAAAKTQVEKPQDILTAVQRAWLGKLEFCESKGNPKALNKKDRDGTPSYGLLQFKPSTFRYYAKRYKISGTAGYKDAATQILIVEQMIIRNDVSWKQQFPMCVKKLGKPPVIHI